MAEEEDEEGNISDMLAQQGEDDPEAQAADDAYDAEVLRRVEADEEGAEPDEEDSDDDLSGSAKPKAAAPSE